MQTFKRLKKWVTRKRKFSYAQTYFCISMGIGLIILEFTHIIILKSFNSEIFALIIALISYMLWGKR